MADKTKHSNDEIFELLSAMAVDIEDLKKNYSKATCQTDDEINPLKCLEKEVMWQRKYVESFPNFMRKYFQDWQAYQERKDDEWYDLMDNFSKQINDNNALETRHKEEIKKALILIKSLIIENKNKEENSTDTKEVHPKSEPIIISKSFKGWLKFLFYDCPKYSLSKPNRRKFLNDLGRTIRLLISGIVIVLLFLLANENHHLKEKVAELQHADQKYKLHGKESIKKESKQTLLDKSNVSISDENKLYKVVKSCAQTKTFNLEKEKILH